MLRVPNTRYAMMDVAWDYEVRIRPDRITVWLKAY